MHVADGLSADFSIQTSRKQPKKQDPVRSDSPELEMLPRSVTQTQKKTGSAPKEEKKTPAPKSSSMPPPSQKRRAPINPSASTSKRKAISDPHHRVQKTPRVKQESDDDDPSFERTRKMSPPVEGDLELLPSVSGEDSRSSRKSDGDTAKAEGPKSAAISKDLVPYQTPVPSSEVRDETSDAIEEDTLIYEEAVRLFLKLEDLHVELAEGGKEAPKAAAMET